MDETTAPVLDPGRGRTKTGYLWPLARDDRGWGGDDPPGVVFTYKPTRAGAHAEQILQGFDGILLLDGYIGYEWLTRPSRKGGAPITVAHCWAQPVKLTTREAATALTNIAALDHSLKWSDKIFASKEASKHACRSTANAASVSAVQKLKMAAQILRPNAGKMGGLPEPGGIHIRRKMTPPLRARV